MKTYHPITPEIVEKLKAIVGPSHVKTDKDILVQYQTDYETNPLMLGSRHPRQCRGDLSDRQTGQPV